MPDFPTQKTTYSDTTSCTYKYVSDSESAALATWLKDSDVGTSLDD